MLLEINFIYKTRHGDIKASNILVFIDEDDGLPTAKISDFGFSSTISSSSYHGGGTPAFAAPECTRLGLARHPKLLEWHRDKLQDVYSYGLLLWQVAMDGKGPYSDLSRSDIEAAKTDDPGLTMLMNQLLPDTPLTLRRCIEATTKYMPPDRIYLGKLQNMLLDGLIALQRHTKVWSEPELGKRPLRITYVAPDPVDSHIVDLKDLDWNGQFYNIVDKSYNRKVMLERVLIPIAEKMGSFPTVLHLMGRYTRNDLGTIFENEAQEIIIDAKRLVKNLRLALLSACDIREVAQKITNYNVLYTIDTFYLLADIARRFEATFYQYLVDGNYVEEAMWETRIALLEYDNCVETKDSRAALQLASRNLKFIDVVLKEVGLSQLKLSGISRLFNADESS